MPFKIVVMVNICDIPADKLPFSIGGLCLQEPTALMSNMLISITAFVIYYRYKSNATPIESDFHRHWKQFFLFIGLSTFFGGFGHVFFYYTGFYGKFPSWILAFIAAYHSSKAMISLPIISRNLYQFALVFIFLKFIIFLGLALYTNNFLFVTLDSIITYLFFCMGLGIYYWQKGLESFKFTVLAVLVLIPSVFIFTLDLNPGLWFNKNDLSHVLIAITIVLFYIGIINFKHPTLAEKLEYVNK